MNPKFLTIVMLILLMPALAFGGVVVSEPEIGPMYTIVAGHVANRAPEPKPPVVPDPVPETIPETIPDPVPEVEAKKIDWMAFFQEYLIPLIALLSGLFGGGFGVRFRDRRAGRKKQVDAVKSEGERVLSMLSRLVPQLHDKLVLGDKDAIRRGTALAKAKQALDEVVKNGI